jgi:hypothetical protein
MNDRALIGRLEGNTSRIRALVEGVSAEEATWRPAPEKWSILEVTCHLLDEEREDFRARLDLLLHSPGVLGPSIDPKGWVKERRYNQRDLQETLKAFMNERSKSMDWLRSLASPVWENSLTHPAIGTIKAGDMLGAWVAHDVLHIRQLAHIHWRYIAELAKPYAVGYAGDW